MTKSAIILNLVACMLIGVFVSTCAAQLTIARVPKDGSWARYEMISKSRIGVLSDKENMTDEEMVFKSELTIRSVGTKYINMEAYRWIEMETKMKMPGPQFEGEGEERRQITAIVKVLVPEVELKEGKPFADKIKKIYMLAITGGNEQVEEIDPASEQGKQLAAEFTSTDGFVVTPIETRDIETGIGTLKCTGVNICGFRPVEGLSAGGSNVESEEIADDQKDARKKGDQGKKADDDKKQDDAKQKAKLDEEEKKGGLTDSVEAADQRVKADHENMKMSNDMYYSEKSPFGLVKFKATIHMIRNKKEILVGGSELTLQEIGTGAKSAMPDKK